MPQKKNILAIVGSASAQSANLRLVEAIAGLTTAAFDLAVYNDLKTLPHFDPGLSIHHPPAPVVAFRRAVQAADGIIICTPEYVFSIPSGLKNAIEWCIATTVFSGKPTGLITASASGEKGHEELQLIMKTAMAKFTIHTTLLVQGIKAKFDTAGNLCHPATQRLLLQFIESFTALVGGNEIARMRPKQQIE